MAWVMGCDPKFKHNDAYVQYMITMFNKKITEAILKVGRDAAEQQDFDNACIHFRACLCVDPRYLHAMYSYAKVCRALYEASNNKEYVGRFKAESMEYFELITEIHPRFAQAYYYLGYAYLNMGLYAKAQAAWKGFLRWSQNPKDTREIKGRIKQIADPVRIEEGYTDIMARRYSAGIDILEPYLSTQFKDWWPLHYYLGIAYDRLGRRGEAVARFKQTLALNGSHLETMEELTRIYREEGDKENAVKYENKIRLIRTELEKERRELERLMAAEDLMSETDGLAAEEAGIPAEAPKKAPAKTPEKEAKKVKRLK
jgi:tetratricopeptide (TPR) repeat protein